MKRFRLGGGRTRIGVDVSGGRLRAAQLEPWGEGWRLAAWLSAPGEAACGAGSARRLAALLERRGFEGNEVVAVLPRELAWVSPLELPARSSGAPLEQIARVEMARVGKCEAGGLQVGMWDVPAPARSGEGTHVMCAAAQSERLEEFLGAFDGAGLDVAALDLRACALARGCAAWVWGAGLNVAVEVGYGEATVVLVHSGRVIYERTVAEASVARCVGRLKERCGLEAEDAEAVLSAVAGGEAEGAPGTAAVLREARSVQTEFLDALTPEVEKSISYAAHRYPGALGAGVVLGETGLVAGVAERLSAVLGAGFRVLSTGDVVEVPEGWRVDPVCAAIGAAQFVEQKKGGTA